MDSNAAEASGRFERSAWADDRLDVLKKLKQQLSQNGRSVVDLSMLNPDISPPRLLLDKLLEASCKPENHRYAVSRGIRRLREAFALKYHQRFQAELDPETQVCATMGTKDALLHALMLLAGRCPPGRRKILIGAPSYPAHVSAAKLAGFECGFFAVNSDQDAMLSDISRVLARDSCLVTLLNFPNNPTGLTVSREFYREVLKIAGTHGCFVLNDFVYGEMSFDEQGDVSLLSEWRPGIRAAETYSLSKAYSVPGWRVGALHGDADLVGELARLKAHIDYGIFLPVQMAAVAALTSGGEFPRQVTSEYQKRCRLLHVGLKELGWDAEMPKAGASVWAKIPLRAAAGCVGSSRSVAMAERLLRELGVLTMPGVLFGADYDDHLRFAAVSAEENLREVLFRMERL